MSDFLSRFKQLIESEGLTYEDFAIKAKMKYSRVSNLLNERGKIKAEEIEALGKIYPEYRLWLAYGEEIPEAGQISPMTKEAAKRLNQQVQA